MSNWCYEFYGLVSPPNHIVEFLKDHSINFNYLEEWKDMSLSPGQAVKMIILQYVADKNECGYEYAKHTGEEIDQFFDNEELQDDIYEAKYEIRQGKVETNIPSEYSRHYESKSVAAKASNGQWVGWTYWYGGGKYGDPEAIDWMQHAYFLDCKEEEKLVVVQTFSKKEEA